MSPRALLILLLIATVAVAGAAWSIVHGPETATPAYSGEAAFPKLAANPDAVRRIFIRTAESEFSFRRTGTGVWVIPAKHLYPASARRIHGVVAELADMRLVEAKTRLPERYGLVGVEPVETPDANSVLVRLEDGDGTVLAHAIFGVRIWRRTGDARYGIFMREPEAEQAWLASGGTDFSYDLLDWLDRGILDIDAGDVTRISVRPPSGDGYSILRKAEDGQLALEGGQREVDPAALDRLAAGLARLSLNDVAPRDRDADIGTGLSVTTNDGLVVDVALEDGDGSWIAFAVTAADTADEAVKARAAELQGRLGPWRYRVAEWQHSRLFDTAAELGTPAGEANGGESR